MQLFTVKIFGMLIVTTICTAFPLIVETLDDDDDTQYVLVPVERTRRDINWGVGSPGVTGTVSGSGTIVRTPDHLLTGNAHASKDFTKPGRPTVGGGLDYSHLPTGSGLSVGAERGQRGGVDFGASGRYNIHHSKNWDVGLTGQYTRPSRGRPDYGVGLGVTGRF